MVLMHVFIESTCWF